MKKKEMLRGIPKVDEILKQEPLFMLSETHGAAVVKETAKDVLEDLRKKIMALKEEDGEVENDALLKAMEMKAVVKEVVLRMSEDDVNNLHSVVNATGTILHTNLGRAPLCKDAVNNVAAVASGYSNLEYNVEEGKRGSRHDIVGDLIAELTGAEDAMVVNNNAAATMIVLASMGAGKEIIVSRGELVEIGGAFRIPDIMEQSGATLKEIGCTNKTKVSDYENAIGEDTGALMKVHKSNYDICGFTEEATLEELVEVGKKNKLPVIYDMGNGLMLDMSKYGLNEPNVPASLKTGIDVILFSGDKLLGGPQAGIIAGKKKYIKAMKKHPLARAMRVDKMIFAALEETLKKYRDEKVAKRDIPILNMIVAPNDELKKKAEELANEIRDKNKKIFIDIVEVEDQIGGGSAPMVRLPGWAVSIKEGTKSVKTLEKKLRKANPPVVARIHENQLLLSARTLIEEDLGKVAEALKK